MYNIQQASNNTYHMYGYGGKRKPYYKGIAIGADLK